MGNCVETCDACVRVDLAASTPPVCHGDYRFGQVLGEGSQAQVQACTDTRSGRELAVKVFDRSRKRALVNYRRELDVFKACGDARSIVHILDNFLDRRHCFVVMERYAGNLHTSLKWTTARAGGNAKLEGGLMRRVMRQAFSGVLHLHGASIVHRDVKAQNFMVTRLDLGDEAARVVLGDFGLARPLEHGSTLIKPAGTRRYWAPELYDRRYCHKVDIFALGVLLAWSCTGEFPFLDEAAVRHKNPLAEVEGRSAASLQHLEPQGWNLLQLTLEKDPNLRPSAAELVRHPWLAGGLVCAARGPRIAEASLRAPIEIRGDFVEMGDMGEEDSCGDDCMSEQSSDENHDDSTRCSSPGRSIGSGI